MCAQDHWAGPWSINRFQMGFEVQHGPEGSEHQSPEVRGSCPGTPKLHTRYTRNAHCGEHTCPCHRRPYRSSWVWGAHPSLALTCLDKDHGPSIPEKASQAWDFFGSSKEWKLPGFWKQIDLILNIPLIPPLLCLYPSISSRPHLPSLVDYSSRFPGLLPLLMPNSTRPSLPPASPPL